MKTTSFIDAVCLLTRLNAKKKTKKKRKKKKKKNSIYVSVWNKIEISPLTNEMLLHEYFRDTK